MIHRSSVGIAGEHGLGLQHAGDAVVAVDTLGRVAPEDGGIAQTAIGGGRRRRGRREVRSASTLCFGSIGTTTENEPAGAGSSAQLFPQGLQFFPAHIRRLHRLLQFRQPGLGSGNGVFRLLIELGAGDRFIQ